MTYCSAPFNSIRIDATDNFQATYKPCCVYKSVEHKQYSGVAEYLQSSELIKLQQNFLDNATLPQSCGVCQQQENQNQVSLRQHFNSKFNQLQKITQLEIFPGNVCNLQCFMCSENFSTALGAEQKKLNLIDNYQEINNVDSCIEAIMSLPELKNVSFIGGEFFLTKKNLEILDLLIQKQIQVRVVTNATVILPAHLERLKKIPGLELQISIDGIQESYEFMRYPGKWNTVDSNIRRLKNELPDAQLNFNFVVQPLNIQYMVPTLDYANRLIIPTRLTNLIEPTWLTWVILTDSEKQQINQLLNQQQTQYKLTTQQTAQVNNYQKTLENTTTDLALRNFFVQRMNKILQYRQIPADKIAQHLAKLPTLLS